MIYKVIKAKTGNKYMADNLFIAKSKIPEDALMLLDGTSEVKFTGCIFCGHEATMERLITGVMVHLCNDDYYSHTVGQVVAQLRKEKEEDGTFTTSS